MKEPKPRKAVYWGMCCDSQWFGMGTWLEPEEITYPNGAMVRRARAVNAETGRLVVVRCGIADTFFSIPVRGGGWLGLNGSNRNPILIYHPRKGRKDRKGEK